MAGKGGGGGEIVPVSPRARRPSRGGERRSHKAAAWLSLDIVAEIAVRSDAATLVRCAATCRGARRRIAGDPNLRARLRLRDTGRFLLPLLRGHLAGIREISGKTMVCMVDTTAADTTRVVKATITVASVATGARTLTDMLPMDSRGGLVLVRATVTSVQYQRLLVCNPATGRCLDLPPEPAFPVVVSFNPNAMLVWDNRDHGEYVLLVGDRDDGEGGVGAGATVGRPFQVLKVKLVLSNPSYRRLMVQTFSSDHGTWSPLMEIPTPNIHGNYLLWESLPKALVVGDVVHWLCQTDVWSYVLMLDVRAARVNEMALPASFPHFAGRPFCLLATASAGGNPIVLVADNYKVLAWEQSSHTKIWLPQMVIENKTILRFMNGGQAMEWTTCVPELLLFGERSGAVLIRISGYCLIWLDLHSKKIVRCFSNHWTSPYAQVYCPYEVDHSSWVPTFSSAITTI